MHTNGHSRNPRHQAAYRDPATTAWQVVDAKAYDPATHGTDLRCMDPRCRQPVGFRKSFEPQGDSFLVPPQFFARRREAHIEHNCTWLAPELDDHRNSISLEEAFAEKHRIILNMNFNMGHPLSAAFGSVVRADGIKSPYNDFRAKYTHASIAIHSLDEFYKRVEKIKSRDPAMLNRTYVGHCQDIRRLDTFNLGAEESLYLKLYNIMLSQAKEDNRFYDTEQSSFARLMHFVPTENARNDNGRKPEVINGHPGSPISLERKGGAEILILNAVKVSDLALREYILRWTAVEIAAVPTLRTQDVSDARRAFSVGDVGFIPLTWKVDSKDQIRPAPGAEIIRRPPDPSDQLALSLPS